MKQPRNTLKQRFLAGNEPSENDFADVFDSFVHIDEQTALNTQVMNQRLAGYDNELKGESGGAFVKTLGDVLARVLSNWPRTQSLYDRLAQLSNAAVTWASVSGKPAQLPVRWTEQIIETNALTVTGYTQGYNWSWGWLAASHGAPAGSSYVIQDIYVQRKSVSADNNFMALDGVVKVKLGLNPYVTP